MSSHWEWAERVVDQHDREKPFAPENGEPLKFKIGDRIIYTNDDGVSFRLRVAGFYQPVEPCSLYATGRRYILDWNCPWFPVKEAQMLADADDRDDLEGLVGKHHWAIGINCGDGYPVLVDDCLLPSQPTQAAAKAYALEIINRIQADGDYLLDDQPQGFMPGLCCAGGVS